MSYNRVITKKLIDKPVNKKTTSSMQVSVRFNKAEYVELKKEAERKKLSLSAYIRSTVLMRISGELIEKQIAEEEFVRRNVMMKRLDDRGTF